MSALKLCVGGHIVAVSGASACFFERYPGCRPFLIAEGVADWEVRYDVALRPLAEEQVLSRFAVAESGAQCCFGRSGDCYRFAMRDGEGRLLVDMQHATGSRCVEATACCDATALRFSLWFALSMLMPGAGCSFVHSSTVVWRGRAVMFLGESGTGKSTHSRLWMQHIEGTHLLNDDSPILSVGDGGDGPVRVYGSPWSGKTPCYRAADYELAAVVRLSQGADNSMRRLRTVEGFAALQPSLPPALMQDVDFADGLIAILTRTLAAVPFYHLQCRPDAEAALLCHKTVFNSVE